MRVLIIANCTNRKRATRSKTANVRDLAPGTVTKVATEWIDVLSESAPLRPLTDVYCGRGFNEVLGAARDLDAVLLVVSAGLGLVDARTLIPTYGATISGHGDDNVLKKLQDCDAKTWWTKICRLSPYSTSLTTESYDLILVAVSRPYFPLIELALENLDGTERKKVRLFSSMSAHELSESLAEYLMPYGSRFDDDAGPLPGTKSDFTQRALRHFVNIIVEKNAQNECANVHAMHIERELKNLSNPVRHNRQRLTDDQIETLVRKHWEDVRGSSSRMLRFLRDNLGVACEQRRFQSIFNRTKEAIK